MLTFFLFLRLILKISFGQIDFLKNQSFEIDYNKIFNKIHQSKSSYSPVIIQKFFLKVNIN